MEIVKFIKGQKLSASFMYTVIYMLIFLGTKHSSPIFFVVFIIISATEIVSYETVGSPITKQILTSISMEYASKIPKRFYILVICLLFALASISFGKFSINIRIYRSLPLVCSIILLFFYINDKINALDGEIATAYLGSGDNTIYNKLYLMSTEPAKIIKKDSKLKNIILLNIESFEYDAITPTATPFIYNLSKNYLFMNVTQTPYTHWTASATLISQCGIPQLMFTIDPRIIGVGTISGFKKYKCLPDYYKELGYKVRYYGTDSNLHGFKDWKDSKYENIYIIHNDTSLFKYVENDIFNNLTKTNEPYLAWIMNEQTHMPHNPPKWCTPENTKEDDTRKQHNCYDQVIRSFINRYLNSNIKENTVLIVYPDHYLMKKWIEHQRYIFMLFPGISKDTYHRDNLTYYDFSHTVLELSGIHEVSPGFPFGRSVFSPMKSHYPTFRDFKEMYLAMTQLV